MAKNRQELVTEIGARIKAVRQALNYSQDEMARLFGIGRSSYYRYERGQAYPGPLVLNELAHRYHVSLDWLVGNKGSMFGQEAAPPRVSELEDVKEDVRELLVHMERIPLLRYKVLTFFQEFKLEHKDLTVAAVKDNSQ